MSGDVKRMNKDVAGFLILNIIAESDGQFDPEEGQVISQYIHEHFPIGANLEEALEILSTTRKEDYTLLFQRCAEDFYLDSNQKERLSFIQETMVLINADRLVDPNESYLVNKLYQYWDF